ncbi:zinc finger protein 205-like isoform X2 [Boleophthalmus pectinirostris]|uniref:zinc finger protein 205-like isoform X2 n=1 Tax=Boleophthalmus pectinirostris TaxID=150288 RepID=UPI002432BAE7|nr:zinc finger protein 205-like isoform X2 [Boleophthalmus pectinirostris]
MSKGQMLKDLVNARLTAAAEEIFALFERTIAEYEEELRRSKEENQRKEELLEALNPKSVLLFRADIRTGPTSMNQGPNQGLNLKIPKTPRIKENPEEQCIKQEEESLSVSVSESSSVSVKRGESSQLLQTKPREETQGEGPQLNPETEGESDTDNSEDWRAPCNCSGAHMETEAEEPGTSVTANNMTGTAERTDKTTEHKCSICRRTFRTKHRLKIHTRVHTGEKPCSCPVCGKKFAVGFTLKLHMRTHTGARPFSCPLCEKAFSQKGSSASREDQTSFISDNFHQLFQGES